MDDVCVNSIDDLEVIKKLTESELNERFNHGNSYTKQSYLDCYLTNLEEGIEYISGLINNHEKLNLTNRQIIKLSSVRNNFFNKRDELMGKYPKSSKYDRSSLKKRDCHKNLNGKLGVVEQYNK